MSAAIPVTQFLRPNAAKRYLMMEVSDEAGKKWKKEIEPLGLRLTAEVIPGSPELEEQVCVCLENWEWGDYRIVVQPNIPDSPILKEVETMVREFNAQEYQKWLTELLADEKDD